MGHGQDHVAPAPVLEAEHLLADGVVAPGGLPHVGGMQGGHGELLGADGVHLLAEDAADTLHDPPTQR